MQVELIAKSEYQQYRIIRRYLKNRTSSGVTDLQLQILSGDEYKSISGSTIAETQQSITTVFGMDYRTFANSVYLVQGKSDNFTISTPIERKEVLGKILNLTYYDMLVERSKDKARLLGIERDTTYKQLESLETRLEELSGYQNQLDDIKTSLTNINLEISTQEDSLSRLKAQEKEIRQKNDELIRLQLTIKQKTELSQNLEAKLLEDNSRLSRLRKLSENIPSLEAKILEVKQLLGQTYDHEQHAEQLRLSLQELANNLHLLRVTNDSLKQEGDNLRTKINLFSTQPQESHCPLCKSELSEIGHKNLIDSYDEEIKQKAVIYKNNKALSEKDEEEHSKLKSQLEHLILKQKEQQVVNQNLLVKLEADHKEASTAKSDQEDCVTLISELTSQLEGNRSDVATLSKELDVLRPAAGSLDRLLSSLSSTESAYSSNLERRGQLLGKYSLLEEQLVARKQLLDDMASKKLLLHKLIEDFQAYGDLAIAFGKGGIQALLIEASVPFLEQEANLLLSRMTDNRLSLTLETRRAKRSSRDAEQVETLEVYIGDELGTRSYELFSGGEKFRINLALRIALSKLIAWRSGSPLTTLFIDEGFGTQDLSGQEKIVEVINSIQEDFQLIIVITHIEEIKEAFPLRIEVSKTEQGSSFIMV
tara:strand:+ start:5516 stop:7465 length:1950 start_codon:yes stop_codon:yes gene_type:complete